MFCRWREALLVVQLARLSSSLVELPELTVLPVLPKLTELCSAAGNVSTAGAASTAENAPSMAWTAILTASLAYLNHTCSKFGSAVPAVPTWHIFGSPVPAALWL